MTGPRERRPAPLLKRRLPSNVGAMMQPNATGDGDARLSPHFWLMVVLTGVATGLVADVLMLVLFSVQRWAFGTTGGPGAHDGTFITAVAHASPWNRVWPLLLAGVVGGVAWYLLRRFTPGKSSEADEVLWTGEGRLSFRRSFGTSLISETVIGLGVSLGREAAPKLMGAVAGNLLAERARLTPSQRRLLVACGGGAGLACVYDVPLGGALFTAEVLLGTVTLPVILPALACSAVATVTAWLYLPEHAAYVGVPGYAFAPRILVWALIVGPLLGLAAAGYVRLIGWVSHYRLTGWRSLPAPLVGFGVLALVGLRYPQLYGNGKGLAYGALVGAGSLGLLAALAVLKPLVTLVCLGTGASGGLFTPVLATGAALGACLGLLWSHLWPGSPAGAYAMVGAAALVGAGMQAPLAAIALVLELTHASFDLAVPIILATVTATAVARWVDGYSIYTARLRAPADVTV